jgi:hypothetical protein
MPKGCHMECGCKAHIISGTYNKFIASNDICSKLYD